ncbi:MAG: 3-hydroxyacyl-ACP dehydratase FabZ [Aquificae bacterium]|nr:3-hydroxyacyl-ACP dehydratase FabZ [Aquificota bacterium]
MSPEKKHIDILEIMKVLPHRYPFLLVDRIVEFDLDNLFIKAIKNVTINEPYFVGHFPEYPVMPGVLIIEAMAQIGAYLLTQKVHLDTTKYTVFFAGINDAKFRRPVFPGDQIVFEIKGLHFKKTIGKIHGIAKVDTEIAVEATLLAVAKKIKD